MDRFIPNRDASGAPATSLSSSISSSSASESSGDEQQQSANEDDSPRTANRGHPSIADEEHTLELTAALNLDLNKRILSFSSEPPPASNEHAAILDKMAKTPKRSNSLAASQRRRITTVPARVLDAPGLVDDYYLNVLDWSSNNLVAIALEHQVYIWNAESGDVSRLCHLGDPETEEATDDYVCALKFSGDGSYLAVGTSMGPIQIYDVQSQSRQRTMAGHVSRVPTLSWSGAILSSGSRDGSIWNSDVRVAQHKQSEMKSHRAEVCGLAWRQDLAGGLSGGGMGVSLFLFNSVAWSYLTLSCFEAAGEWRQRQCCQCLGWTKPFAPKDVQEQSYCSSQSENPFHKAVVYDAEKVCLLQSIAWCPWQSSMLATGGGTNDKVRDACFWV